jgi:ETFB lysine methyltransferase
MRTETLSTLQARFDVVETRVDLGDRSLVLHHPRDADALIDEAAFERDERLPYWAHVWPSARVLAAHVARHQGNGRTSLELGAGSGLVACALAIAGYEVTASDYYEDSLHFTNANVLANCDARIATRLLDWRSLPEELERYQVVVAADVLYERTLAPVVAQAFARTIAAGGYGLIADPGRVGLDPFLEALPGNGLRVADDWQINENVEGQRHTIRILALVPG